MMGRNRTFQSIFVVGLLALLAPGCAETFVPTDEVRLKNREEIRRQFKELESLQGEFYGEIHDSESDRLRPFRLFLVISGEPYKEDGVPDETTAPTLSASVWFYTYESHSETYVIFDFERSDHDPDQNRIMFYSSSPEGVLTVDYDSEKRVMTGYWSVSARGKIGDYRVIKVPGSLLARSASN